jgi:hypothetical protein
MSMITPFVPTKHKGLPLLEMQDEQNGDVISTKYVPSTSTFEDAAMCPWYYAVDVPSATKAKRKVRVGVKGGSGSGNYGHAGRPGIVGGSSTVRIGLPSAGLGLHHIKASDLNKYLPKTVAADVGAVASKLGRAEVKIHVVPEGYIVNNAGGGVVVSYNSLKKLSRTTEAVAGARPKRVPKNTTPEDYDKISQLLGRPNDVMIDETPGSVSVGRAIARAGGHVAKGAVTGALAGAVGGGATELADLILSGKLDSKLKRSGTRIGRVDIGSMVNFIKRRKPKTEAEAGAAIGAVLSKPSIRKTIRDISAALHTSEGTVEHAFRDAMLRGAIAGGILGGGSALQRVIERGTGQFKREPRYILKQLRTSGRASVGSQSWAMLIRNMGDQTFDLDVYRSA